MDAEKLTLHNIQAFGLLYPEVLSGLWLVFLIFFSILFKEKPLRIITFGGSAIAFVALAVIYYLHNEDFKDNYNHFVQLSPATEFAKFLIAICAFFAVCMAFVHPFFKDNSRFYAFCLGITANTLALTMWLSTSHLLIFILSLELASITLYFLAGVSDTKFQPINALSYLIFGAFSLACTLYGLTFIFPFLSEAYMIDSFQLNLIEKSEDKLLIFISLGLFLFFAGILFKTAFFPFQIWAPKIYDSVASPFLGYLSIAPKIAGISVLYKLSSIFQGFIDYPLIILIMLTILAGTLPALAEENMKKLLAYSSIAHAGLIAINTVMPDGKDIDYLMFFLVAYMFMNLGWAAFIQKTGKESLTISNLKGIGSKNLLIALNFSVVIVSLIGLPPSAGFTAKFFTFLSLWKKMSVSNNTFLLLLLVVGVGSILLSLFYYIKIPFSMFISRRNSESLETIETSYLIRSILVVVSFFLLALFIRPELIWHYFQL